MKTLTFPDWLDAERGRATQLARHFNVTQQVVYQWRLNGVPRKHILDIHEITRVPLPALITTPKHAN